MQFAFVISTNSQCFSLLLQFVELNTGIAEITRGVPAEKRNIYFRSTTTTTTLHVSSLDPPIYEVG